MQEVLSLSWIGFTSLWPAWRETRVVSEIFTSWQLSKNLDRLRVIALALPEATEELTWGTEIISSQEDLSLPGFGSVHLREGRA